MEPPGSTGQPHSSEATLSFLLIVGNQRVPGRPAVLLSVRLFWFPLSQHFAGTYVPGTMQVLEIDRWKSTRLVCPCPLTPRSQCWFPCLHRKDEVK